MGLRVRSLQQGHPRNDPRSGSPARRGQGRSVGRSALLPARPPCVPSRPRHRPSLEPAATFPFFAQPVIELPAVDVAAEAPPPAHDAADDPAELPVTTRDRAEIEARAAHTAGDALVGLPGVYLEGNPNQTDGNQQVRVRGFAPRYTLVLVDGERLVGRDADGAADLGVLASDALERVDLIRGPLAVLYGGDAIGGVVDLVTAADVERASAHLALGYGAFETARARARAELPLGAVDLRADLAADTSAGWSDRLDYDRALDQRTPKDDARPTRTLGGGARVGYRPSLHHRVELAARAGQRVRERHRESHRTAETGTTTGHEDNRDLDLTATWIADPTPAVRVVTAAHTHRYTFDRDDRAALALTTDGRPAGTEERHDQQAITGDVYTARSRLEWLHPGPGLLRVQAEARHEARTTDDSAARLRRDPDGVVVRDADYRDPGQIYHRDQTVAAATAEERLRPHDTLLCVAGLRGEYDDRFGVDLAAAGSVAWRPWPSLSLRYAAGRGFKRPDFDTLARPPTPQFDQVDAVWRVGDPTLVPEHATSHELGLRLLLPGTTPGDGDPDPARPFLVLGLTAFHADFEDKIVTEQISEWAMTPYPLVRERNLARATSEGVELDLRAGLGPALVAGASYTLLLTRDETTGAPFDRTPAHLASAYATATVAGARLTVTLDHVGERRHYDALGAHRPEGDTDALLLLGARLQVPVYAGFSAFAELHNGLDWYWDDDADGDTDLPPPSLFAGVRFDFEAAEPTAVTAVTSATPREDPR